MTFVLGLTGSIGMGKSVTAGLFRRLGVPVHDADAAVHALYRGRAVAPIAEICPQSLADGVIDRSVLASWVLQNPDRLNALEAIVHPMVREEEINFLGTMRETGFPLAVLDVPLLLEKHSGGRCDAVALVTAPVWIQRERVLHRAGMTREKFESLLKRQMPDDEKRRHAHFLIETDRGIDAALSQVKSILMSLAGRPSRLSKQKAHDYAA